MITSLFDGNPAEILLGLYVVVPFALGLLFSVVGLIGEMAAAPSTSLNTNHAKLTDKTADVWS